MLTTLIGDIHQRKQNFNADFMPPNSIQLGDLGFQYNEWKRNNHYRGNTAYKQERRFVVEGNHENFMKIDNDVREPRQIAQGLYHIPRGYISGHVLFVGGADSIDKNERTPGYDWFPEEHLSQREMEYIFEQVQSLSPSEQPCVVLSHDVPAFMMPHLGIFDMPIGSHSFALWEIYNLVKPILWVAAHHHQSLEKRVNACNFVVLNIAEKREFDLPLAPDFFTKQYKIQ